MENIIETVKSIEDSDLFIKGISETIENEVEKQKGGFLGTLLSNLCTIFSINMSAGKWTTAASRGQEAIKSGKRTIRTGQDFQCFVILLLILKY